MLDLDVIVPVAFVLFGECDLDEMNDSAGEHAVFGYRLCADALAQR